MERFGDLVRGAMERRGNMEGKELAELIGKSPSYVSKIVNNNLKETPSPEILAALERVLGLPQPVMLSAWGYRIEAEPADVIPIDSERATVISLAPSLDEADARVVRITMQAILDSREGKRVARSLRETPVGT